MSEPASRAARRAATAQRILAAARAEFGEHGLEAATIRRIARRADVDPSLVMQHYGSKAALFAVAIQLEEAGPDDIETHLHDVLDVRLAELPPETRALVRSMLTAPEAGGAMSAFLNERVANLSRAMGGDDADLRAALIVSSILGLTIARHFLKLDAFASAATADIARVARPWITTGVGPAERALSELVAAAGQIGGLGGVARQLDGLVVGRARLLTAAQPAQQHQRQQPGRLTILRHEGAGPVRRMAWRADGFHDRSVAIRPGRPLPRQADRRASVTAGPGPPSAPRISPPGPGGPSGTARGS